MYINTLADSLNIGYLYFYRELHGYKYPLNLKNCKNRCTFIECKLIRITPIITMSPESKVIDFFVMTDEFHNFLIA